MQFRVVTDALEQLALLATVFDGATERHAALVFLLTTGLDGAVAVFVGPGHLESPNASTGSTGWARGMTVWRRGGYRMMNLAKLAQIHVGAGLPAMAVYQAMKRVTGRPLSQASQLPQTLSRRGL
ncbi:MAG: hypothetical protein A2W79_25105 [Pseudomonadales bacterium RIFCSPLOWO2_12_60_38]|nr:hypothetical protein H098_03645 [Pseudomonas fluorescens FH5]OHC35435.1 MAG: hypothetical protein A2W79_25105 [Pseudomonadales bacterium RIFCSPLOWO2_12_60_38]OHC41771.1 MAG: hypothetical protein A3G72_24300 [Pseudomonadales bacterium RIFCSPLOWO2_12_FULL_59_450]